VRWFYGSFMACRPVARHVVAESVDATVALLSRPRTWWHSMHQTASC